MFQTFIYNPILVTLQFIYQNLSFGDLGIAVILLTLLIRIVLFPLFLKGARDQAIMKKIQPEINRIQKEKKGNPQAKAEQLMQLYKTNKLNPLSSIFVLIIQLPVFFALFKIFTSGISNGIFDHTSLLGLVDLKEKGGSLALLAGVLQYFQVKLSIAKTGGQKEGAFNVQRFMMFAAPVLTLVVLWNLPKALALYWVVMTLFSIPQQWYIEKRIMGKKTQEHGEN